MNILISCGLNRSIAAVRLLLGLLCVGSLAWTLDAKPAWAADLPYTSVVAQVQPKIVKIYGVGGFRGLESYQSGFIVSPDGHILTVWSYVLDTDLIQVTLNNGQKYEAKLLGADPVLEIAVLKIEAQGLPFLSVATASEAERGDQVLAFSNLYGVATGNEAASVQHGIISVKTNLEARRGTYTTPYNGPVYVLDAMTNNPGASGGALVNARGELLGMLGKELRNAQSNVWLNYAIPASAMNKTVDEIMAGVFVSRTTEDPKNKPAVAMTLDKLGLVMVPDVLERTPPYVDLVREGTPAADAGIRADDLVLFINDRLVQSCKVLRNELQYIDHIDSVRVTLLRGQELVDVTLAAPKAAVE